MTPERWKHLKSLFEAALDLPKEQRSRFVDEVYRNDPEFGKPLDELLAAHEAKTDSLDAPLIDFRLFGHLAEGELAAGTLLLGRFEIVRHLGSGGMGDVYEAIDLELGRIALKTIRPSIAKNPAILSRFKEEVKLARKVNGPNICRIYELYVPPPAAGCPCAAFLTMEFLEGVTLAERIAKDGPVAPKAALGIATQLCAALQSIHGAGVVHRDLKPRNIMLVPRNGVEQVVVMDFGLARAVSVDSPIAETGITMPGTIMGTPDYMAPEQFEPGGKVSPATDIYALGIVLYELVTGLRPFAAPTPLGAAVRRGRQPESTSSIRKGVPPVWDDVIFRCLEYEPEHRYQSAAEALASLNQHALVVRFPRGLRVALSRRAMLTAASVALLSLAVGGWRLYRASRIQTLSPEGQRFYNRGMMALRDGTYLQAIKNFKEVVILDKKFALTHARLADAWAELDSTGQAQAEMLQAAAPEAQDTMPDLGREYVDAVRKTLIRDYSAAAQDYEDILNKLPEEQKAQGYVDLGRAYEKAGRIKDTIANYERAAKINPDDPAPFVHLGILKSRQRDPKGAETAFNKAEALYQATSNQEGLAEVAYQRGYTANEASDSKQAREYLNKSLVIAREISNPQLEARTLTQLSSVEYNAGNEDQGIEDADRALKVAVDNDLEYWHADAEMRLGNAYLQKNDFVAAESHSQDALRLARQYQHPRLVADAAFTLASIRELQGGQCKEETAFAREALTYFKDFGFMDNAANSSTLIVQGELCAGDFAQAHEDSIELVRTAEAANSNVSLEYAEDMAGAVSSTLEDYPDALHHYERALNLSRITHDNEAIQEISCADALWRLGRYDDAELALKQIPDTLRKRADITLYINGEIVPMRLSQGRYRESIAVSQAALKTTSGLSVEQIAGFRQVSALAEGRLGETRSAHVEADALLKIGMEHSDEEIISQAELVNAELFLSENHPEKAWPLLEASNQYFSKTGMKESQWRSFFLLAEAASASGDTVACSRNAKKALDILNNLEQSWGSSTFALYSSRPDHRREVQQLSNIL